MNNFSKSEIGRDRDNTCKSHSARPDRAELYRICPSKLSKRELEDLYFALLENNLELKRTLNDQQERLKILSTKVQRMTATQKHAQSKENNDCCAATKAVVCEQKNSIEDLKTANERMADRIKVLNMRLCSAKLFLRRNPGGPAQGAPRCNHSIAPVAASLKNSSMSALYSKPSETNPKPSVSSQYIDKDACVSKRSVETETQDDDRPSFIRICDENKCKTLMEELQQKIDNLEEELSNTHEEYSDRISRLEREVSDVRKENILVRSERIANEHELQQRNRLSSELVANLRAAEGNCNELTTQLSIEKRKVAELETQLKAADMSHNVAKSIEDHLTSVNMAPNMHAHLINDAKADETNVPKSTEDSGYMDTNKSQDLVDNKGLDKLNDDLMKKISDLESQLDHLKASTAAELAPEQRNSKSLGKNSSGVNLKEIDDGVNAAEKKYYNVMKPEQRQSSKSKRKHSSGVRVKDIDVGTLSAKNKYDDALIDSEERRSKSERKDSNSPSMKEINDAKITDKEKYDDIFKSNGKRRSSKSKHRDSNGDNIKETDNETITAGEKLKDQEKRRTSKSKHSDSDDGHVKEIINGAIHSEKMYDDVLIEPEKRRNRSLKHLNGVNIKQTDDEPTNAEKNAKKQFDDALIELEKRRSSKSKHKDSNGVSLKDIDDEAITAKEKYNDKLLKEQEKRRSSKSKHRDSNDDVRLKEINEAINAKKMNDDALIEPEKRRSSKSKHRDSDAVHIKEIINEEIHSEKMYDDALIEPEKGQNRSLKQDFNGVTIKQTDDKPTNAEKNAEKQFDDALIEFEKRRSSKSKHRDSNDVRIKEINEVIMDERMHNDALFEPEKRRSSKSKHSDSNSVGIKYIDDGAKTVEKPYNDVLKELENNTTIATNKVEEPKNTDSIKNALVTDGDPAVTDMEQVKSTMSPTLGSSKNIYVPLNSSEKESDVTTSKDNTSKSAQLSTSTSDQHDKQVPEPAPSNGKGWSNMFFKILSIDVNSKNTQQNKTTNDPVQENQSNDNNNKLAKDNISRSVKSTELKDNGTVNKTDGSVLANPNTKTNYPESINDVHTKSTIEPNDTTKEVHDISRTSFSKDSPETYRIKSRDSISVAHIRMYREKSTDARNPMSMNNLYDQYADAAVACTPVSEQAAQADDKSPLEFCASHTRICACPVAKHRSTAAIRTCSGTLLVKTIDTGSGAGTINFRTCHCNREIYSNESCAARFSEGTQEPPKKTDQERHRSAPYDHDNESVRSVSQILKRDQSTSPENTDCEISYMTDLPSEKNAKSPRQHLSPGEDKATTTFTDSYTTPLTTDCGTLSEGELPAQNMGNQQVRRKSMGEKTIIDKAPMESSPQQMEATLQAISKELARCKKMLQDAQCKRPEEAAGPVSRDASSTAQLSAGPRPIALHRAVATQGIGDAYAPKCVFTLHIGTVVLSDEAIMNSRKKTLMLTWQFYDQNVAMTRMRAGRVVVFDFSIEYDVNITDDFLKYMKHGEMPLMICEVDRPAEPFASCALPLRDALLNINRRADMSLALVAGPRTNAQPGSAAADALDAGDELGVLDLWCMLRAEPRHVPAINRAIARPSIPTVSKGKVNSPRTLEQVVENERPIKGRMSQDLDLSLAGQSRSIAPTTDRTREHYKGEVPWHASAESANQTDPGNPAATATRDGNVYDASKYPAVGRYSAVSSLPDEHRSSGIIINEVAARIKSHYDMKQAIEQNMTDNNRQTLSTLPKNEEDLTSLQTHSSMGSFKGIIAKMQKSQRASKKEAAQQESHDSDGAAIRPSKFDGQDFLQPKNADDEGESEIYRKYDNILKTMGSNKPDTSKKSVKIFPRSAEPLATEEPQRDTSAEWSQQSLSVTVLWLALNEECEAMMNARVQRLYVAYTLLGRSGAELETPVSLPKPKHYADKCYFNFKKTFQLEDLDLPLLGHMARCRAASRRIDTKDCIVFTVVSEPPEDPLGLDNCEDIGYAYMYLGDVLAYSGGSSGYTDVVPVRAAHGAAPVCGVLAVRVDGLDVVRRCLLLSHSQRDISTDIWST